MDLILGSLCMIMANRVPKGLVAFRTESLANKIKLISPPRGVEAFDRTTIEKVPATPENPSGEQEVKIAKNTNERAIVRILVPKRTMTLSEINAEQKKEEEQPATAEGGEEGVKNEGEEEGKDKKSGEGANESAE